MAFYFNQCHPSEPLTQFLHLHPSSQCVHLHCHQYQRQDHPRNVVKHLVGADGGQEIEGLDLHSSERHISGVLHSQEDAALLHDAFAAGHLL